MKNQVSASDNIFLMHSFTNGQASEILLNSIEQSFLLIDLDLRIIGANDFARRSAKELLGIVINDGISVLELAPPDRHEFLRDVYKEIFEGKVIKTCREFSRGNDKFIFEIEIRPAKQNGQIVGAVAIAQDISEIKFSEKQLQAAEERWRFALEGANQGVWDWDLNTDEVYYSESYRRLYGFSPNDPLRSINDWKALIHPDDRKMMDNALEEHLSSEHPFYETKYRIRAKNGDYRWVLARGMLMAFDKEGRPSRMIGTHTDITEQVNAEQHYKTLFKSNPLPCWIYEAGTGKYLEVNEAAIERYGYSEEEFLSNDLSLIHPVEEHAALADRLRVEKDLQSQSLNNRVHRKKNGEIIFVDLRINAIDYKGTSAKLVVAHEVTSKVKIEKELRKSNERFLYASKAASEALWEWDFETEEFYASDAYTDMFGWTSNDQRSLEQWKNLIHPDDRTATIDSYLKAVQDPKTQRWNKEYRYRRLDGNYAHVIDKAVILRNENGEPKKIIGAIQDVTAQKLAEENTKFFNERFDIMMRATNDLIWDWNLETNNIYRDEVGLKKVYGVSDNKTIEHIFNWIDRVHPADKKKARKSIDEIMASTTQNAFEIEYRFRRDDGTYSHVYDRGIIIRNDKGQPVRMIGAAQDITERKMLEKELLLNELEKQKAINQATVDTQEHERGEIGKELHDNVNQVLTTTKLYLDLAQNSPELKDEMIQKSTNNIINVINEIRQLSRSLMDPSIGDLGLIDSIKDLTENINLTRKLQVKLNVDENLEGLLDQNHKLTVFRIIQETMNNALKHAKANTVHVSIVKVRKHIQVTIEDNGIGFDMHSVKKGVGLKNIQNRVYLINGNYTVDTAPGKGCRIFIKFPINKQTTKQQPN
jgi:PAS domain S-box-containing protein